MGNKNASASSSKKSKKSSEVNLNETPGTSTTDSSSTSTSNSTTPKSSAKSSTKSSTTTGNAIKPINTTEVEAKKAQEAVELLLKRLPISLVVVPESYLLFRKLLSETVIFKGWTFLDTFQELPSVNEEFEQTFKKVNDLLASLPSFDYNIFARKLYDHLEMDLEENFRFDLFRSLLYTEQFALHRRPITLWSERSEVLADSSIGKVLFSQFFDDGFDSESIELSIYRNTSSPTFYHLALKVLEFTVLELTSLRQHYNLKVELAFWFEFFDLFYRSASDFAKYWATGNREQLVVNFGYSVGRRIYALTNILEEEDQNPRSVTLLVEKMTDEIVNCVIECFHLPEKPSEAAETRKSLTKRERKYLEADWNQLLLNFYFTVTAVRL